MAVLNYDEISGRPLVLPVGEHTYTVPPVSVADGLLLMAVQEGDEDAKNQMESLGREGAYRIFLGPVYDEMLSDGQPFAVVNRALRAANMWFLLNIEAAEAFWNTGSIPEAVAALAAAAETGTSTGEGSTTPKAVSGTGTRSRKTNKGPSSAQ